MGFLASSASRQPLPVKITKVPLTVPWNTVENSWALRTQRPQVPSPGHLSTRELHLCRAKRMSQVSSRAFRSVDSRGRWTLLGWLPIGGDLESTGMHLGLRICNPGFYSHLHTTCHGTPCFKEEADPSPSPGGRDLLALWPQSLVHVLFSGMVRGKSFLVVVLSEEFAWRSCSSTGSRGGRCYWQPFCGQEERQKCTGDRGET